MFYAILPAAGYSTRMGQPKLSLPLGKQTVLERVLQTLQRGGIQTILVVVGPHVPELVTLAQKQAAHTFLLKQPTLDMRQTIEVGLDWLEQTFQPQDLDAWFLVPADHPLLETAVLEQLIQQWTSDQTISVDTRPQVWIPTTHNRRGHPTLINWNLISQIRQLPKDVGLNALFRNLGSRLREVPMETESILWDMDTPSDYERILQSVQEDPSQR